MSGRLDSCRIQFSTNDAEVTSRSLAQSLEVRFILIVGFSPLYIRCITIIIAITRTPHLARWTFMVFGTTHANVVLVLPDLRSTVLNDHTPVVEMLHQSLHSLPSTVICMHSVCVHIEICAECSVCGHYTHKHTSGFSSTHPVDVTIESTLDGFNYVFTLFHAYYSGLDCECWDCKCDVTRAYVLRTACLFWLSRRG